MTRHRLPLLALLLALGPLAAVAGAIRKFDTAHLEALGRAIYDQDKRVAIATDMMLESYNPEEEGIRGWVVEGDRDAMLVRFVRETGDGAEAVLDARFDDTLLPVISEPKDRALTDAQLAQLAARNVALGHIAHPCSERYNSIVLPDPERGGMLVYALAATEESGSVLAGGHYRFTVSGDGHRLGGVDALSDGCTKLPKQPTGKRVVVKSIAATPLETHVFLNLLHKTPLYVATTDKRLWKIENGRMSVVEGK
ncbi:MAG: hypothetical protein HY749_20235 [Gammaproteobacteria bacterium]|nr:hypothetical protein [Gammaproteobacteria bacterium]